MVDILLGMFVLVVIGSTVTAGLAGMGLIAIAVVEWVKYRSDAE